MTRPLVDELWQSVDIRAEEFLHSSVVEDVLHDRRLGSHTLQHFLRSDILSGARFLRLVKNVHLVGRKQDVPHLFGRRDVESLTSFRVYPLLIVVHPFGENSRRFFQCLRVDAHTVHFHVGQHRHEGHLDVFKQFCTFYLLELGLENVFQFQGNVGVFCRILINLLWLEVGHILLAFPLRTDQFLYMYGFVVE